MIYCYRVYNYCFETYKIVTEEEDGVLEFKVDSDNIFFILVNLN